MRRLHTSDRDIDENLVGELVAQGILHDTFRRLRTAKKQELYRIAVGLLGDFGYDGLSVDQFCREANVSKGSFFQYFPSKSHLLETVVLLFDRTLSDVTTAWAEGHPLAAGPAGLRALADWLVLGRGLSDADRRFLLFALHGLRHSAVLMEGLDLSRHFRTIIEMIVIGGRDSGTLRKQPGVNLMVESWWDFCLAALRRRLDSGGDNSWTERVDLALAGLVDGQ